MRKLVVMMGGAVLALTAVACSTEEPRDYDAEPTEQVEEGEAPECIVLSDETDTEDDEGKPLGTYCRQEG